MERQLRHGDNASMVPGHQWNKPTQPDMATDGRARICDSSRFSGRVGRGAMAGRSGHRFRRWAGEELVEHIRARVLPMESGSRFQDRVELLGQGDPIMDRKDESVMRVSSRFLLISALASLAVISPLRAVEPGAAAPATELADGTWTVEGRAVQGARRCGNWLVRLTSRRGQLSGVVSLAQSSVPIQNLVLQPNGSFSGRGRAGLVGSRHIRGYRVSGKFSGDTVSLTFQESMCPPRHGTAVRKLRSAEKVRPLLQPSSATRLS
jgi:hypothetical protein